MVKMCNIFLGIGYDLAKALVAGGAETFALSKTQANLDKLKAEVRLLVGGWDTCGMDNINWAGSVSLSLSFVYIHTHIYMD